MPQPWNHNIHYHDLVLRSMPSNCRRALDVGCGEGLLARKLAQLCDEVIAIDLDHDTVTSAAEADGPDTRITFVEGDALTHPFPPGYFDFIAAIATLHHLPLIPALERFRDLLSPGGVLAVIGLARSHSLTDYAWSAASVPGSWLLGRIRPFVEVAAPVRDPQETLRDIRDACARVLPGAVIRRRPLFRYSLIWRKP